MRHVCPKTLKTYRATRNLSQDKLATLSGVSKKQISRLEAGATSGTCREYTVTRLAKALKVAPEVLAKSPDDTNRSDEGRIGPTDMRRQYVYVSARDRLHYHFIEKRYGITADAILRAAPVLFLFASEKYLAARRESLASLEEAQDALGTAMHTHLRDASMARVAIENVLALESKAIEACDLTGRTLSEFDWSESYPRDEEDPFVDFLHHHLSSCTDLNLDSLDGPFATIEAYLFEADIDGLAGADGLARFVLERGDVDLKEIPEELLSDDRSEERVSWLRQRASPETLDCQKAISSAAASLEF